MSTKQVSRMRLKCLIFGWIATMLLGVSDANASILTLYDGSSGVTPAGFTPQQLNFFSVAGGTETYRPAEQATELQTTTVHYAGYSNFTPAGALVNAKFPLRRVPDQVHHELAGGIPHQRLSRRIQPLGSEQ